MERIDKILSNAGVMSRNECKIAVKRKQITLNGEIINDFSIKADANVDDIRYKGEKLNLEKFVYIMLNKPLGVVSATNDGRDKTVIDLVPTKYMRQGLFPCGRLDKDTVGLVIITNDGQSAHRRLAPKTHAEKVYYFTVAEPIKSSDVEVLENGVTLKDGFTTAPCKITLDNEFSGHITLTEGKYHEIKRMFGYTGNKITYLKRVAFAGILLDDNLKEGECRLLTLQEKLLFIK